MSTVPKDLAAHDNTGEQPAWKRELNDKVAAARAKRQSAQNSPGDSPGNSRSESSSSPQGEILKPGEADSRSARVAAAVAARYAQAPTYSEYLAQEVRTAVLAAAVAQEAAELAHADLARAVAETQQARAAAALLAENTASLAEQAARQPATTAQLALPPATNQAPQARVDYAASGIPARSVQHYSALEPQRQPEYRPEASRIIADPLSEAIITPAIPLPAKLLEFPRELIAARKARPRHAEGPLREEAGGSHDQPQLRIFEVEPESISTRPEAPPQATEWSSIRLDAHPAAYPADNPTDRSLEPPAGTGADTVSSSHPRASYSANGASPRHASDRSQSPNSSPAHAYVPQQESTLVSVASLEDRLMAGIVDAALVAIAFLLFAFIFTATTLHPPTGKPALISSGILLAGLYLLYQFLFFTFADATPGMSYARIALCTFDDDNPTRHAMRKRIFALILAAMPLGLGFLYAIFDEEHLGWHDRMTRMYQRSYK